MEYFTQEDLHIVETETMESFGYYDLKNDLIVSGYRDFFYVLKNNNNTKFLVDVHLEPHGHYTVSSGTTDKIYYYGDDRDEVVRCINTLCKIDEL